MKDNSRVPIGDAGEGEVDTKARRPGGAQARGE